MTQQEAYRSPITPTLVLTVGAWGSRISQSLIEELRTADDAVQEAIGVLNLTCVDSDCWQLRDKNDGVLVEMSRQDPAGISLVREQIELIVRDLGSHAIQMALQQAHYGSLEDSFAGRQPRCYLIAAFQDDGVAELFEPLAKEIASFLDSRHGICSMAAFCNIATYQLQQETAEWREVMSVLEAISQLPLAPCVLFDFVKAGGLYARPDELQTAVVALLRVLLLADEPAALLQKAQPKVPLPNGDKAFFSSVGVAVLQHPPATAVANWLAAHYTAAFIDQRCLRLPPQLQKAAQEEGEKLAQSWSLKGVLSELLTGLPIGVTVVPHLSVTLTQTTGSTKPDRQMGLIDKEVALLTKRLGKNQMALEKQWLADAPEGRLPKMLQETVAQGPHGLGTAQVLLTAVQESVEQEIERLARELEEWPLRQPSVTEPVTQAETAHRHKQQQLPEPQTFAVRIGIVAAIWGLIFGFPAGRIFEAGGWGGVAVTAVATAGVMLLWLGFKQWQIGRTGQVWVAAYGRLQAAELEKQVWETTRQLFLAAQSWIAAEEVNLHTVRARLEEKTKSWREQPLQLPNQPIIIETLPYQEEYRAWLADSVRQDPLLYPMQQAVEQDEQILGWWNEPDKVDLLLETGQQALPELPSVLIEEIVCHDKATWHQHLSYLHKLALPFINLDPSAIDSSHVATVDIACWDYDTIARQADGWNGSCLTAGTHDPQRVTYLRIVPGFTFDEVLHVSE